VVIVNLLAFLRQVQVECKKITWPLRNEVIVLTVVVFLVSLLTSVFFFLVDSAVYNLVKIFLGLGS
jgi:preprotein translocase subunit SecE